MEIRIVLYPDYEELMVLTMDPDDKVSSLRKTLNKMFRMWSFEYSLVYEREIMRDGSKTLEECGITEEINTILIRPGLQGLTRLKRFLRRIL